MNDTFAWLWVVLIVGMTATALLLRYWVTIRSPRYLYAAYATTVVWIGALLVFLALTGSAWLAAVLGALLLVSVPFVFIRDKCRIHRDH
jgi:hypothetical protein